MVTNYTYGPDGLRISKASGNTTTAYIWDGGNIVNEFISVTVGQNTTTTENRYVYGIGRIKAFLGTTEVYYLYNAHGDVTGLTDSSCDLTKSYVYDAFGVEVNLDTADTNPFRYCGEYFDKETETYYLRARHYNPCIGRFISEDTHWNVGNMIYGDNPLKINQRKDALGLKTYTYVPSLNSIKQASNLYTYCVNNPLMYRDMNGEIVILTCIIVGAIIGAVVGGAIAAYQSQKQLGYVDGWWVLGGAAGGAILGGLAGWGVGAAATAMGAVATAGSGGTLTGIIYETWQQAEQSLRNLYNAVSHTFQTPFGNRIADAWNSTKGLIAEAKYGYVSLTQFVQSQIAKDAWLLQQGYVSSVEWHFYISQVTGQRGPSAPLLAELIKNGFIIIFH